MDPQMYEQLIFDKASGARKTHWTATCRRMNMDHFLIPYTKINSKWMKDLNIRQDVIKILEEKTGKNLFDLGRSNFLLDISPEARETKAKMDYWDLIKIKSEGKN